MADPVELYTAPSGVPYRDGPSVAFCVTQGGETFSVYRDGDVVEYVVVGGEVAEARWPQQIDLSLLERVGFE